MACSSTFGELDFKNTRMSKIGSKMIVFNGSKNTFHINKGKGNNGW